LIASVPACDLAEAKALGGTLFVERQLLLEIE
jgi:hypothetical protein